MAQRIFSLILLCAFLVAPGCARRPPTAPPAAESPQAAAPVVPADDPAAIAALEATGVILTRNEQGNVITADCRNADLVDEELVHFTQLPRLTVLRLENAQVTNEGLAILSKLPLLEEISLRRCTRIGDEALRHLTSLPHLTRLHLLFTLVTNEGLARVGQISQLRLLDLRGCKRVSDAGLAHLSKLDSLVDLKLSNYDISNQGLASLAGLTSLRVLSLEGCSVDDEGLKHLSGLTNLVSLNLDQTQVTDHGLKHLSGLPLRELSGLGTSIFGPGLSHLVTAHKTLEALDLSETSIENDGLKAIAEFPCLQRLILIKGTFDDAGVSQLSSLGQLRLVNFSGCYQLTGSSVETLRLWGQLKTVRMNGTGLDDAGLLKLGALEELSEVQVSGTKVTTEGVAAFQKLRPECKISN